MIKYGGSYDVPRKKEHLRNNTYDYPLTKKADSTHIILCQVPMTVNQPPQTAHELFFGGLRWLSPLGCSVQH